MAIITFIFISLLIFIHPALSDQINQACKATRYQKLCESSLTSRPKGNVMEIIKSAISVSSDKLHAAQPMAQSILKASAGNLKNDAKKCIEQLRISDYRLKSTTGALAGRKMKDARAWTSDGLGNQYESLSALKKMKDTKLITDMKSLLTTLINCTSNALSMMLACDLYGEKTASWSPPKTERDGVWERHGLVGKEPQLGVPAGLKADVTVCKGGGCKYATVQQAVNASPNWGKGRRFVILIKAGVYKETVQVGHEKQNIVFLGDGLGKTVISGALSVGKNGISTYFTATVGVLGDGFMAKGLTFENTAGSDAHQAVAFRSSSDKSILENCEFLGHQDTLYALSLRQFYKSCRIHGNVDFIFGNAAAIFQDCTILIRPRQSNPEKGEDNAVTAHSRNDPAQSTGFVFRNCLVNGTEEYMKSFKSNPKVHKNFLGRPWKEFARTVFIGCKLEALITPQGWMPWTGDVGLKTLYYGEFGNTGKGSVLTGRVAWSSRIPANHVNMYSIVNFLQGDQWKLT